MKRTVSIIFEFDDSHADSSDRLLAALAVIDASALCERHVRHEEHMIVVTGDDGSSRRYHVKDQSELWGSVEERLEEVPE